MRVELIGLNKKQQRFVKAKKEIFPVKCVATNRTEKALYGKNATVCVRETGSIHFIKDTFTRILNRFLTVENIFNTLIDSFIENKIGIADQFLSQSLSLQLQQNLSALYAGKLLTYAGTGNSTNLTYNKELRGDKIYWLDRKHEDVYEDLFFDLMDAFVEYLNRTCYTGITGYEFHYTLYETGSFYKKHLDQFRNKDSRKYSMVMYLNNDWTELDGGELCIYTGGKSQNISPNSGKSVFFKSDELEHEVLLTNKPRMSITGWLKS